MIPQLEIIEDQPSVEIRMADGIFIKQVPMPHAGMYGVQHVHTYDHTSMLAVGSLRVWKDGVLDGDYTAPTGLLIKAGVAHTFMALQDNTIIYCIHNISRSDAVEILADARERI